MPFELIFYFDLVAADENKFMERTCDKCQIFLQFLVSEDFFRTIFLCKQIDQLNDSKESKNIATVFKKFDEFEERNPNL